MQRDITLFPNDDIGNKLWKMSEEGDDLTQLREIEFSVLFSKESSALTFGKLLLENNQKVSFCPYEENTENLWEITAYPAMDASYENITAYVELLTTHAEPLEGRFDEWYC